MNSSNEHSDDPVAEYAAAQEAVELFELRDRTQIEFTGDDRVSFLNNFCTNDLKQLAPGGGCEAFLANIKGRVLGHVFLFVEDDSLWLETVPGQEDALIAHLDKYLISEEVEMHRRSGEYGELYLTGPKTFDALRDRGVALDLPEIGMHGRTEIAGIGDISMRRVDWFDTPGLLLVMPGESLPAVREHLTAGGAIKPAGLTAFEVLRIESRFPWYGRDITDDNLAQEVARTDRAISFTKGCYLGQEPIARIDAMGHVNRELRGLRFEAGPLPTPGDSIFAPGDEKEIGRITSAARLSEAHPAVALGYVRSQFADAKTQVEAAIDGARHTATVF